mmetsp:Transcript_9777/g.25170  ORF Transcript_9777/g.25170 Transcript_9777/m.25170 type:complete len:177 (-) Transcript_9777:782-1312(-)
MAAAVSCAVAQLLLPAPPVGLLSLPQPLLERVAQSGGPALLKLACSQLRDVVGALEAAAGGRRSRLDVRHVAARQVTLVWAVRELRCPLTADTAAAVASSGCVAALQWARDQVGSVHTETGVCNVLRCLALHQCHAAAVQCQDIHYMRLERISGIFAQHVAGATTTMSRNFSTDHG